MKEKEIINLESEKGTQIIQNILSDPPVVLVGAAISMWSPTNLPLGGKISHQLFDLLFPESFLKKNKNTREIIEDYFTGNEKKDILGLPFEVIFEGCPKESKRKLVSIFKKVFSTGEYNPVHEALGKHFLLGGFPAIITTNYDLCLDELLGFTDLKPISPDILRIVTENDFEIDKLKNKKIYFKIHGSVDDKRGETLVFSLRQERRLPEWKKRLLYKLFRKHQSLLIIGYSGSDFEICPELFSSESPLKKIIWNVRKYKLPNVNVKRFKDLKNTVFLKGDMRDLLGRLMDKKIRKN